MLIYINTIDQTMLFFIQGFHCPVLDKIMIIATSWGNRGFIWLAMAGILAVNKKTRSIGLITLAALILSTIVGEGILKHLIQRPRPYTDFPSIQMLVGKVTSYSFPSGHATSSFAAAYVLSRYLKKYSPVFWTMAFGITFSRIYLFMHYPTDIIAGIVLGLLCGKTVSYLYENKLKNQPLPPID